MEKAFDYIRTFFTKNHVNGRLGCFGQEYKEPYVLNFSVYKTDKRQRSMFFSARVSDNEIEFIRVGYKKKYSEDDVIRIMNSVAAVSADFQRWRDENK